MAWFFNGLQLWEKMIFVLGCVIGSVFCVGVGKLWWSGRRARMQFINDEEKRGISTRTREANPVTESQNTNQVPFGVRAMESGIEIDGIWISRTNTPVLESPRILRVGGRISNSSMITNSASAATSLASDAPQPGVSFIKNISTLERSTPFESTLSTESFPHSVPFKSSEQPLAYKPKRSSQLRFSSYGDFHYHEETLCRLEGRSPTGSKPTARFSPSIGPTFVFNAADSLSDAGTDNDRSSGSSNETDGIFRCKGKAVKRDSRRYRPIYSKTMEESTIQARANASESIATIIPANDNDYFSTQKEQFTQSKSAAATFAFSTPIVPPGVGHSCVKAEDPSPLSESKVPLLYRATPSSPKRSTYESDGVHMNKTVRKVNSNFEVLPAGTFGMRHELIAMVSGELETIGPELRHETSFHKHSSVATVRQSKKLQKQAPRPWIKSRVFGHTVHD